MILTRFLKAFAGLLIMPFNIRRFDPSLVFKGKRIAIVGPASSVFEREMGEYINNFDLIIRLNKAPHTFKEEHVKFLGRRTDILFHSFFENNYSGGGSLDFELYKKQGIKWVINPRNTWDGWRGTFNFYKKYLKSYKVGFLPIRYQNEISNYYGSWWPTMGGYALFCLLTSEFKECYITGFTFFKTPYGQGYRDELTDMKKNIQHIKSQGIHNPELEFDIFIELLLANSTKEIHTDDALSSIISNHIKITN